MNKNKSNDPKIVNWEYLPDSTTLIEYLDRVDVVELGKCCKRYRKQFEKIIFDMLNLTSYLNKNKVTTKELKKSKDYDELTRAIKEDLGDKLNLVKKFKFNDIFCLGVAGKVAELLPNINTIVFNIPNCWDCESHSLSFLSNIKYLEHIKYQTYQAEFETISLNDVKFSKYLKSIMLSGYAEYFADIYIFNEIDSSYATNLTTLCLSTNKLLTNFTPLPSLKEVRILGEGELERPLLVEFFKKNPQLRKIELNCEAFEELLQIILSYKDLNYLSIYGTGSSLFENTNYHLNYSIKKLKLDWQCYGSCAINIINIINSCKNLENLIFYRMESDNFNTTRWLEIKSKIKTLELRWFWYGESNIEILDNLQLFDQIKFTECTNYLDVESFKAIKLKNYVIHSLIGYPVNYTLKIINKQ